MENRLELMEEIIHALVELTDQDAERLWESWHMLDAANGYDFHKTLVDFLPAVMFGAVGNG